ncbi:hypothetical protein M422DRAFT_228299 [Sphaerobolus stellatus SS14]|uniref:Protein kinase domain-containing protein n=1 Tax=Sphaerobolus stellatus (strain SS14) TaxID=990650 RepID=A0A0C9VPV6_SPHS4|nr:hypothetical protein M422DRAFT_228299 [Sphaerobolus stellatus SS14]
MLAVASSLFGRTNIAQSYVIGASAATTPSSSSSTLPQASFTPTFHVGPWKVQCASHKTTGKRVSVWSFDKRSQELERVGPTARERVLEVLKAEAGALRRLRHPSILEMVEPLEETRSELIFATEPLLSSLTQSIPGASRSPLVDLDEVEIQKGILQICKGLSFLHTSARLIHSNISSNNVMINASGDWKISGLGLTISLTQPDGSKTRWEFPTYDSRLTSHVQRSFDYMAPEYALDEQLVTASDMYSLGCLIFAVHNKGRPPFQNHGSLGGLRENAGKPLTGMENMDHDLKVLLGALITRHPNSRPDPTSLPSYAFFSSLPISTLNFLDRSTFASKSREEKVAFMKGLVAVLPTFSDGLRTRKILPSLVEEMKDTHLLPYILPNIFFISKTLPSSQFASVVLPSLKPLFAIKEPPQNMLTLLDNLNLLQEKTDKQTFKEHVLPLVYNALESEHALVQERALKTVPDLCESIDYAEVQSVLFPRVALVFTKTRILTVKVSTLECFLAMVKTLDQTSLTQKLVPLLSKIRTREPAVMIGTLAVQEAMGMKVDREAVATLVLPQLWAMSMGPLINIDQFQRFMNVIRKLGDRVEKEHTQFLKDSQRIEDRSGINGSSSVPTSTQTGADFESLVGGASATATGSRIGTVPSGTGGSSFEDDIWGSILASTPVQSPSPAPSHVVQRSMSAMTPPPTQLYSSPSTPVPSTAAKSPTPLRNQLPTMTSTSFNAHPPFQRNNNPQPPSISQPNYNFNLGGSPLQPMQPTPPTIPQQSQIPNYNIQLPPANFINQPLNPASLNSVLSPNVVHRPSPGNLTTQKPGKDAWGDFDPLS